MGAPGWPEFAFCTASMDRVRMVSMASFSIAGWGTLNSRCGETALSSRLPVSGAPQGPTQGAGRCQRPGRRVALRLQHGRRAPGLCFRDPGIARYTRPPQMSDTRAAIRELRSLSEKRSTQGLTEQERSRLAELRERLGLPSEPAEGRPGGPQPGGTAAPSAPVAASAAVP